MLTPSLEVWRLPTSPLLFSISLSALRPFYSRLRPALATLCRRVIQIGWLNESHVLPTASNQTSAFDGRSISVVRDPSINGVPPRALLRVKQSQGPDRA